MWGSAPGASVGAGLEQRRPEAREAPRGFVLVAARCPRPGRRRADRRAVRRGRSQPPCGRRMSSPLIVSPAAGTPTIASSVSPPCFTDASRVARTRGDRQHIDLGADVLRPRDGALDEQAKDRLQPVVARVMQMIGLRRGEQDAVDARRGQICDSSVERPARKAVITSVIARSRSAHGGAGRSSARSSASTSTICRSSRAK